MQISLRYFSLFLCLSCCLFSQTVWGQTHYYSKPTGDLNILSTWGINADGTGTTPADFTSTSQLFHISNGTAGSLSANWVVSGGSSKIIVDGTDFTIPTTQTVTGIVDVNAGRTLTVTNPVFPTWGTINATSTIVFKNLTTMTVPVITYGNITFDNTTVTAPGSTTLLTFAGNFTVQNGGSFIGGTSTSGGLTLVTTGNANQVINSNGLPLACRNIDVGSTNPKAGGTVTLAPNTNITVWNSLLMVVSGPAAQFIDGGNTLTVRNNIDLGGNAAGYNFTGTIIANGTSGTQNFRSGGASTNACVAALNNVKQTAGPLQVCPTGGAGSLTIKGNLLRAASTTGAFTVNANTLNIGGNFTDSLTTNTTFVTVAGSQVQFNGTATQTYYSATPTVGNSISNLKINNPAGLTLNAPIKITGTLTLTSGLINTGTNTLTVDAAGTVSGASATSYINGSLLKVMPSGGTTTMLYEVGDNSYSPVKLTFSSSVNSGNVTVRSTAGAHPQMASSYVNSSNAVNRFWTITTTGVTPSTINLDLSYNSSDITGSGGSNTGYIIRQYASSNWSTMPAITNTITGSLPLLPFVSTTTGVTGTSFSGDYIAGSPNCTTITGGTAVATNSNFCVSGTTNISLSGSSSGLGISYQWQSSLDGSSWANIGGETNSTYATPTLTDTMYYRSVLTCGLTSNTGNTGIATVYINPLPQTMTGTFNVCVGNNITLSNTSAGGSWSSSNNLVASIGTGTGVVTGISGGTTTITYTLPTGCTSTQQLTVNPSPAPITGATSLCLGETTTFTDGIAGGTWSSNNTAVATIGSSTGLVTSVTTGSVTLTYITNAGCSATAPLTVISSPSPISGTAVVCAGLTITLSNTASGGSWSSSNTSIATVGASTGILSGISAGTVTLTYSISTGCIVTRTITVNATPANIGGLSVICQSAVATLTESTSGGTWTSSNTVVASVGTTGLVTALSAGTTIISYTLSTGCLKSKQMTINTAPTAFTVTGGGNFCAGLAGVNVGLSGSQSGISYQLYNGLGASGLPVSGTGAVIDFGLRNALGTYSAIATNSTTGCTNSMTGTVGITVTPSVLPYVNITNPGGTTLCSGNVILFTANSLNGGTAPTYQWRVNGTLVAATSDTFHYLPSNGDIIKVKLTSNATCAVPDTSIGYRTLTIVPSQTPSVNVTYTSGTSFCEPTTVHFAATPSWGGTVPVYEWIKNGTSTGATTNHYSYTPDSGDVVYCKLHSNYICAITTTASSDSLHFEVNKPYIPAVSIDVHHRYDVPSGKKDTLVANVLNAGPHPTYQWVKNGYIITGATSTIYVGNPFVNGDSIACVVTGTVPCGLPSFNSIVLTINTSGIQVPENNNRIAIVPNPNDGQLWVKGQLDNVSNGNVSIEIINIIGQVVFQKTIVPTNNYINEEILLDKTHANGVYVLKLSTAGYTQKATFILSK